MAINGQTQPQKFSLYRYREGKSDPEHGKWFKKTRSRRAKQAHHAAPIANVGLVAISPRSSLYAEDPIIFVITPVQIRISICRRKKAEHLVA